MSRAWRAQEDVLGDILDQQKEINALLRAISIKLDEQATTNQLLGQMLTEMRDHFAKDGNKVHPGIIVPLTSKKDVKPVCLKCHRDAEIIHNCFGTGEDWVSCKHCGVTWRMK